MAAPAVKRILVAFGSGLLFGAGLLVSQMSNPAKVVGFLDVTDGWDPSLAFVMAGAVGVFAVLYRLALHRQAPLLAARFVFPEKTVVDSRLIIGALVFGVGWGLGGFCPGPAIVSAGFGDLRVWAFVGSMVAGAAAYRLRFRESCD